jgi:GTP-binding protein HflX
LERDEYGKICRVSLSAKTGAGLDHLRTALAEVAAAKKSAESNRETEPHHKEKYVA